MSGNLIMAFVITLIFLYGVYMLVKTSNLHKN
jgi:multisubunit Na+/H+ antiporter MnhC subunit